MHLSYKVVEYTVVGYAVKLRGFKVEFLKKGVFGLFVFLVKGQE